jgi:hypothetical protein
MHQANFCSECGGRIVPAKRRLWINPPFCRDCRKRFGKSRWLRVVGGSILIGAGFAVGRYQRPSAPPLIIQRAAQSPLPDVPLVIAAGATLNGAAPVHGTANVSVQEVVYTCGARTKKGTPCQRRVHAPVRCWQHKGMPAMLPQEKLLVK